MYKCKNCENKFEEPIKMCQENFFGVYELFGNTLGIEEINVCPKCESNEIVEIEEELKKVAVSMLDEYEIEELEYIIEQIQELTKELRETNDRN